MYPLVLQGRLIMSESKVMSWSMNGKNTCSHYAVDDNTLQAGPVSLKHFFILRFRMSTNIESTLRKAQKALAARQFSDALEGFVSVVGKYPANQRAQRGVMLSRSALADENFATNHPPRHQLDEIAAMVNAGQFDQAIANSRQWLANYPKAHGLYNLLGAACSSNGDDNEARSAFEQAVLLKPNFMAARTNLGRTLMRLGEHREFEILTSESLTISPDDPQTPNLIAAHLIELRQFDAAMPHARKAVQEKTDFAEAHNHLGLCLRHAGKLDQAITSYKRAIDLKPQFLAAINNLGLAFLALGKRADAKEAFQQCLDLDPRAAMVHNNLGQLALQSHEPSDALAHFEKTTKLNPDFVDAEFNKFVALCHADRIKSAFRFAECRFDHRRKVPVARSYGGGLPVWGGESLAGKTIIVHAEQGLGDSLMFLRHVDRLTQMGGTVILIVQQPLVAIVRANWPHLEVFSTGDTEECRNEIRADCQIPLMSLPLHLGADKDSLTVSAAYLGVPEDVQYRWRHRFNQTSRLRVGFTFKGSADHTNDANRSIPYEIFISALPEGPEYHFLGIDLERREQDLIASRKDILTHHETIGDFCDTAAIVASMDMVICVDTSVAHLAGALGIPTSVLLSHTPDWRWGLTGDATFWYPSVRLLRQPEFGDWHSVLARIPTLLAVTSD